jgi:hypothetical protein
MTQQTINTTPANSGTGDSPYVAFNKCNANFTDIYTGTYGNSYPAATTLTGTELAIINAAGQVETATTAQIAALATTSPFQLFSYPSGAIGGAGNQQQNLMWFNGMPNIPGGGVLTGFSSVGTPPAWQHLGTATTLQNPNPTSGTTFANSVALALMSVSAPAGSANATFSTLTNSNSPPNSINITRLWSNGLPLGGFSTVYYFVPTISLSGQQLFLGLATTLYAFSSSISSTLNSIGIIQDESDSVVSFFINNGSGAGSKTATTLSASSMQGHLFRLVITCDPLGNCALTLTDLEPVSNLGSFTQSYPTSTAKLPAAGAYIQPVIYISNGTNAAEVQLGVAYIFATACFGGT